jgi:hypothetical protein
MSSRSTRSANAGSLVCAETSELMLNSGSSRRLSCGSRSSDLGNRRPRSARVGNKKRRIISFRRVTYSKLAPWRCSDALLTSGKFNRCASWIFWKLDNHSASGRQKSRMLIFISDARRCTNALGRCMWAVMQSTMRRSIRASSLAADNFSSCSKPSVSSTKCAFSKLIKLRALVFRDRAVNREPRESASRGSRVCASCGKGLREVFAATFAERARHEHRPESGFCLRGPEGSLSLARSRLVVRMTDLTIDILTDRCFHLLHPPNGFDGLHGSAMPY